MVEAEFSVETPGTCGGRSRVDAFFRKAEYDMGVVDMDKKGSDEMDV